MPIVIERKSGVISGAETTPEQSQAMWEAIIRAWVRKHPEAFAEWKQISDSADPE